MSQMEKGLQLSRDLFELNSSTWTRITELSSENFRKYLELNQDFAGKLPEVRDVSTFVDMQREYGKNLWEGVQADWTARGEIVREAVEQTGSLVRGAFNSEEAADVQEAEAA